MRSLNTYNFYSTLIDALTSRQPLELLDYTKRDKKANPEKKDGKKLDFNCLLRVSKAQTREAAFREATVKQVYELLLEYLANESANIAFPELAFPAVLKVRTCRVKFDLFM